MKGSTFKEKDLKEYLDNIISYDKEKEKSFIRLKRKRFDEDNNNFGNIE